ncbi:MAG TPA: hypothetical protein VH138_11380 [Vicinamibacterales bacterium]|nr:hypothetical protein [Vicinamibacterales bacterium]
MIPAQYCYIVARFVLLEHLRSPERNRAPVLFDVRDPAPDTDAERREQLLRGLDACLSELTAAERELIVAYYAGDGPSRIGTRRALATKLGLTANALTMFRSWLTLRGNDAMTRARQSIARSAEVFNSNPIVITGVSGLNGQTFPNGVVGSDRRRVLDVPRRTKRRRSLRQGAAQYRAD